MANGKFKVSHQPGRGYHFVLAAPNGRVIATSEHYETHRACLEGIESVRRNAPDATLEDTIVAPTDGSTLP